MASLHRRDVLTGVAAGLLIWRSGMTASAGEARDVAAAFAASHPFFGVVATASGGRIEGAAAFGKADIEAGSDATPATPYCIGSISKWLTSLTALRLSDAGKLDIDAPLSALLPGYRKDTGDQVRLTHLLSNTSGIPDGFGPRMKADATLWTQSFTTQEAVAAFCSGDLAFAPGSKFEYLFTNWVLVKAIIEAATGEDFIAATRRVTLAPLGLNATAPIFAYDGPNAVAPAYASIDPPARKMKPYRPYTLASGGYVSTVGDLVAAAHGVYGGGFLSPAALTRLSAVLAPEEHYALGGRVRDVTIGGKRVRFAWETGRVDGYRSVLAHDIEAGRSIVVLNNTDLSQKDMDLLALDIAGGAFAD